MDNMHNYIECDMINLAEYAKKNYTKECAQKNKHANIYLKNCKRRQRYNSQAVF